MMRQMIWTLNFNLEWPVRAGLSLDFTAMEANMPKGRKRNLLNVRDHLEHCELIFKMFKEFGDCPAVREAIGQASLIGRAIMRKEDEATARKRAKLNNEPIDPDKPITQADLDKWIPDETLIEFARRKD